MDDKISSYTAANALPVKIFKNIDLVSELIRKFIPPYHLQFIPTNHCNLNCSFCSCKKRDRNDEISLQQVKKLISELAYLGCKSVTITGGGEPLMHPDLPEMIHLFSERDIQVGLVSNGLLLGKLDSDTLRHIRWCRISACDERQFTPRVEDIIRSAVERGRKTDWAFSYVSGAGFNPDNLNKYITFANEHDFTHVRVVSDLCNLESTTPMERIRKAVTADDRLVVYQGRKLFSHGQKNCWISLLKPTVGANGKIYPCCGVQYAHQEEDLDLPESMCMGDINDIREIYSKQQPFCGTQCYRCYYKNYNDLIEEMLGNTNHLEFV